MQLFHTESSDISEKPVPRVLQLVSLTVTTYALLQFSCMLGYMAAGMAFFDALNHAMSTLSTGGYSTKDASIGFYGTAPFGKWRTQTFIAGLTSDELIAPWVIEGAMNRAAFETYVETQLAPLLNPGTVVILDNLSTHRSPRAAEALKEAKSWFLFLPPYSPDLNPIEQAFSKHKAHLRHIGARTYDDLIAAIGDVCALFDPAECWNFFEAAGYASD